MYLVLSLQCKLKKNYIYQEFVLKAKKQILDKFKNI